MLSTKLALEQVSKLLTLYVGELSQTERIYLKSCQEVAHQTNRYNHKLMGLSFKQKNKIAEIFNRVSITTKRAG